MAHKDDGGRRTHAPPAARADDSGDSGRRRSRRVATVLAAVAVGVTLLGFALDALSMSPSLCTSCHEMELRAREWEVSAHGAVECLRCHQTPRPWYALPQRLVERAGLLVRDVSAHLSKDYDDPVDARSPSAPAIEDEVCLQCHDPDRKATSGFRILIDHVEHAKRNGSCVSCHVRTAHPVETRGRALTFMAQCFTCHGTPGEPEASAACGVCHPPDYELVPKTHEGPRWARGHGEAALGDPTLCEMCHEERTFCTGCHGIQMPHPAGWEIGTTGHGGAANANRRVCMRCHGDRLEMCTMCHHSGYEPSQGTWVKQHSRAVLDKGAAWCLECHSPIFCVRCHVGRD